MPQAFPDIASRFEEADIVLGNSNRALLLPSLQEFLTSRQRIVTIMPYREKNPFEKMTVHTFQERTRAFVKIEDGCNRFCSYCIIPYARGRVRSKPIDELREELQELARAGYQEIVLVGINLSAYGQELGLHLCDAVECACSIEGIARVRLGSLEPEQMDPEVVKRLAKQEKLCPQFHLSLQSGCDATLQRMNRHYSAAEYEGIVQNLRHSFCRAAITTDIMVGFPGETDQEFEQSLLFAQKIGFAKAHIFCYSPRPGTRAANFADQVSNAEKERRSKQMQAVTNQSRTAFLKSQLGEIEEVLFESRCREEEPIYEGYTRNYTPVRVMSHTDLCGCRRSVCLSDAQKDYCVGTLKDE